jgi:hypothetical protein
MGSELNTVFRRVCLWTLSSASLIQSSRTTIALNHHSSTNFACFHTHCDYAFHYYYSSVHSTNTAAMLNVAQYCDCSHNNEMQLCAYQGRFTLFVHSISFISVKMTFEVKQHRLYFLTFPMAGGCYPFQIYL